MLNDIDFSSCIGDVARHLLGKPNERLSNRRTLRFGSHGRLAVHIDGKRRGTWSDFAEDVGGGVLDLILYKRGGDRREAFAWLQSERLVDADDGAGRERPTATAPASDEPQYASLSDRGRRLWGSCRPITVDDSAGRYLLARGCALPHPDGDLRWHGALWHPSGHAGPALVGLVTDIRNALLPPLNLHRTWMTTDGSGRKAFDHLPRDVRPQARLVLKHHRKAGGCIRLWPDDAVTYGLGIAEGIETCLTLARVFRPVWSTIDAGNLAAFPYLYPIESITVCVDHDPAGLRAFDKLSARCTAAGQEVRKVLAPTPGDDLNDWSQRA